MGKRPDPPKEASAPSYFVQYAALWCLMLAFFVVLLSMGHQRTAEFKSGMGMIRDAFGLKGGMGILAFWRKASAGHGDNNPMLKKEKEEEGDVVGYVKGMLWKQGLSSVDILQTQFDDRGVTITFGAPILFQPGESALDRPSQMILNRLGAVFFELPDTVATVSCLVSGGPDNDDLLLAAERAAAITRFLMDQSQIPGNRIDSAGYSQRRYLTALNTNQWDQAVLFSIRKLKEQKMGHYTSRPPT